MQTFKSLPSTTDLCEILQDAIFNETGLNVADRDIKMKTSPEQTNTTVEGTVKIPLKDTGSLRLMFSSVSLKVLVAADFERIAVNYEFSYSHPGGGRNGHTIRRLYEQAAKPFAAGRKLGADITNL